MPIEYDDYTKYITYVEAKNRLYEEFIEKVKEIVSPEIVDKALADTVSIRSLITEKTVIDAYTKLNNDYLDNLSELKKSILKIEIKNGKQIADILEKKVILSRDYELLPPELKLLYGPAETVETSHSQMSQQGGPASFTEYIHKKKGGNRRKTRHQRKKSHIFRKSKVKSKHGVRRYSTYAG
jgi:hypothetical protein